MDLDATHIGVLFGASEWRIPSDPKPVRLDRNFQRVTRGDPRYQSAPGEGETDLETIGIGFLEKLRPLVAQLHHKLEFSPDDPIFQIVVIGYAPNDYGPEVWVMEYRMGQEQVATRGDYWQTRLQRPRFTQLYPPEKHAPRTIVESRYPPDSKGPTLAELIQGNDPHITHLGSGEPRFAKVLENINRGQARKARSIDSADFMRGGLPLSAGNATFVLGTMDERHGFEWMVPPEETVPLVHRAKNKRCIPGDQRQHRAHEISGIDRSSLQCLAAIDVFQHFGKARLSGAEMRDVRVVALDQLGQCGAFRIRRIAAFHDRATSMI